MSWLFSQALVEEYLGDICSDGEQSVQSNGKPTQQAYLLQDKMTKYSRLSQFGMTYKPLMESLGEELLTLYLEDFHAKTLVQLETVLESQEQEVQCGDTWHGLLARYDQNTHLWRTVQCSLLEDLEQSLEIFPKWGMTRNGVCWERPMLELDTNEKESGSLQKIPNNLDFFHTPKTTGLDGGSNSRKALENRLMFPTPMAKEGNGSQQFKLTDAIEASMGKPMPAMQKNPHLWQKFQMWPTPLASMHKTNLTIRENHQNDLPAVVMSMETKTTGRLNPTWVEWLMGWPLEWTDLKPLEMDKFHCVQQQPGTSLKEE